ncbi:MAG: hypothetical protein WBG96_20520 [Thermoanaerobaculia bacterium]
MKRLSDEELVLYYYGEAPNPEEIERFLESSKEEQRRYAELSRVLDTVEEPQLPQKSATYGTSVWRRLEPQLEKKSWLDGWSWEALRPRREWALAGAMALLLVVSFLSGRFWPRQETVAVIAEQPAASPERILLVTVAGHLERSEMLLLELVNTQENGSFDLSLERELAGVLSGESRLYRQAALNAGQADVALVLEQLERVLVELAHGPAETPSSELGALRLRLEDAGLLFKVRVVGSRLRQETQTQQRSGETTRAAQEV